MRILHFCNHADRIGGAEVYAHALVDALRARGHEVALFGASTEAEIDRPGLRVIQRPENDPQRLVCDAAALSALDEYVKRFRPEVIHAHNVFSVALEVLHYLCTCGVPLLQTVHDFQLLCPNSWCVHGDGAACPGGAGAKCFEHGCQQNYPYDSWDVLLAAIRQRLMVSGTRIAVVPSIYLAERLRANGWPDVRVLPYFVELRTPLTRVARSDFELLYVGRLRPEKGVDVLLRAMPSIRAAIPAVQLAIVGDGPQLGALRRLARELRLDSSVRFDAKVPREDLAGRYARASASVLPSVWTENSPLVAYESLLSGLPILGSRIGGIPELIEPGCGLTFAPRDPADLARVAVGFLRLSPAQREHMSAAALERSRSFDRSEHVAAVERFYSGLAASPDDVGPADPLLPALIAALHRVGLDRPPRRARPTPLRLLRDMARTLGLPKVLET